jgi:hypothetical protein
MKSLLIICRYSFLTTIVYASLLSISVAQIPHSVETYLEQGKSNNHPYYIIESNRQSLRHLQQAENKFVKELNASYYIVAACDTIFADRILGPANDLWKVPSLTYLSETLLPAAFIISVSDIALVENLVEGTQSKVIRQSGSEVEVLIQNKEDMARIQRIANVTFIKLSKVAHEETPNSLQDLSVNAIRFSHFKFAGLRGEGFSIGLKEKSPDPADIDLKNRIVLSALADSEVSYHANLIGTIIAGGGNSQSSALGVASKSRIVATSFDNLLPDDDAILDQHNVSVQNHSYGTDIENFYGPEAVAYDRSVIENPTRMHVFSSGNSGQGTSAQGPYTSVPQFANITGNMKMAKNVLTVGAHYEDMTIDSRNSKGPAYDGRIKPELTAFGPEGTSDGAAFVSGTCLLIQEQFKKIFGTVPTSDIVKAALITTADDIGSPGVDFISGFGSMNAFKALALIDNKFLRTGTLSALESKKFSLDLPPGIAKLKVSLSWIDPPAMAGATKALVNDLDLKLKAQDNVEWLPWILNPYPHADSLVRTAKRGADHLNSIEMISVDAPASGSYELEVNAFDLRTSTQSFALTYWLEFSDSFYWTYPTLADPLDAGEEVFFRWNSTHEGTGTIELWLNDELMFTKEVDLKERLAKLSMPPGSGVARAIMKINNQSVDSAEFILSPNLELRVEYNCDSKDLISWPGVSHATSYSVFRMGDLYMEEIASTSDTSFQITGHVGSAYYAIAPSFQQMEGVRSFAYDIDNQGVGCYYTNFLAEATPLGQGSLVLNLSTTSGVEEIIWQKFTGDTFVDMGVTPFDGRAHYSFVDSEMKPGVTLYRAVIKTQSDESVETEVSTVYFADDKTYSVFPNPIEKESELQILTNAQDVSIRFYDRTGNLIKQQDVPFSLFRINVADLAPGLYLFSIQKGSALVSSGRLVVK